MALRITIEMIPKGNEAKAYTLAQGMIANDGSGDVNVGNYIYGFSGQVTRHVREPEIQISGRLEGFSRRRLNAWELLRRCLNQGNEDLVTPDGKAFAERD